MSQGFGAGPAPPSEGPSPSAFQGQQPPAPYTFSQGRAHSEATVRTHALSPLENTGGILAIVVKVTTHQRYCHSAKDMDFIS